MRHQGPLLVTMFWLIAPGCDASDGAAGNSGQRCVGPTCQAGAPNKDQYVITFETAGTGHAGVAGMAPSLGLPPLCSVLSPTCDPDDATACDAATFERGQAGAFGLTGVGGNSSSGALGWGASSAVGGGAGGRMTASIAGAVNLACRIVRQNSAPVTACEPAGSGILGAPCVNHADCARGFGCVEENGTAQCRPYCCRGNSSCPTGTYCDLRPVKELQDSRERIWVSVCMPGVSCRFDDPYPCPTDRTCSCPSGKACGVVRSDGTTACVTPGTGTEGLPCPCAANYVCADTLKTCLKVCDLTSRDETCKDGLCQTSTSLSYPWGICVSSTALL